MGRSVGGEASDKVVAGIGIDRGKGRKGLTATVRNLNPKDTKMVGQHRPGQW